MSGRSVAGPRDIEFIILRIVGSGRDMTREGNTDPVDKVKTLQ
jgi:hypothetical protein